jgi:hypothetical protein
VGIKEVTFTASDGKDSVRETVLITVTPKVTNQKPVLQPIGSKTVTQGSLLKFTITASDPDGDPLQYYATGIPNGATFDRTTHTFSWVPLSTQSGSGYVTFTVYDGKNEVQERVLITAIRPPGKA